MDNIIIFKSRFKKILIESIGNTFDIRMLNKLGKRIDFRFDFNRISGISEKMIVQPMDSAKIFVDYFFKSGKQLSLIAELCNSHFYGIDGYPISIYNINQLFEEIEKHGAKYDKNLKKVIIIDRDRILKNWGYLEENNEYLFCFISVDIVENSKIVRKNKTELIGDTYKFFYDYLKNSVLKRDGRIWAWEGDGGIMAFQGQGAITRAVFATLDFVFKLPILNAVYNFLNQEIIFRTVIHPGKVVFKNDMNQLKSPVLDKIKYIDKNHTKPGNVVISRLAWQSLESNLQYFFKPLEDIETNDLYVLDYSVGREVLNNEQ